MMGRKNSLVIGSALMAITTFLQVYTAKIPVDMYIYFVYASMVLMFIKGIFANMI